MSNPNKPTGSTPPSTQPVGTFSQAMALLESMQSKPTSSPSTSAPPTASTQPSTQPLGAFSQAMQSLQTRSPSASAPPSAFTQPSTQSLGTFSQAMQSLETRSPSASAPSTYKPASKKETATFNKAMQSLETRSPSTSALSKTYVSASGKQTSDFHKAARAIQAELAYASELPPVSAPSSSSDTGEPKKKQTLFLRGPKKPAPAFTSDAITSAMASIKSLQTPSPSTAAPPIASAPPTASAPQTASALPTAVAPSSSSETGLTQQPSILSRPPKRSAPIDETSGPKLFFSSQPISPEMESRRPLEAPAQAPAIAASQPRMPPRAPVMSNFVMITPPSPAATTAPAPAPTAAAEQPRMPPRAPVISNFVMIKAPEPASTVAPAVAPAAAAASAASASQPIPPRSLLPQTAPSSAPPSVAAVTPQLSLPAFVPSTTSVAAPSLLPPAVLSPPALLPAVHTPPVLPSPVLPPQVLPRQVLPPPALLPPMLPPPMLPPPVLPPISSAATTNIYRPWFEASWSGSVNRAEAGVQQLLHFAASDPSTWANLVGLYFHHSGRCPWDLGLDLFMVDRDWRWLDIMERDPKAAPTWPLPEKGTLLESLVGQLADSAVKKSILEEAIRRWKIEYGGDVMSILKYSGWISYPNFSEDWVTMSKILQMEEGPEKQGLIAQARLESPRFAEHCMNDPMCGLRVDKKRKSEDIYGSDSLQESLTRDKKRLAMSAGRPTQFHAVPAEERAVDSHGNTLPWSLEWHEDHPNARHQKRHIEEKGPFGKSMRRRGSSRGTRTATPSKKENPTLDGFEAALKNDILMKATTEAQEPPSTSMRLQHEGSTPSHLMSSRKEPAEVMLLGFSTPAQWAAIQFYEKVSNGRICEDYSRDPPVDCRRIPNSFNAAASVRTQNLTQKEAILARNYAGGDSWIKVTFDSVEAAERAVYNSPHMINGYWVYALPYKGVKPPVDKPFLERDEAIEQGLLLAQKRAQRSSQTLGPSFAQNNNMHSRANATLPRSFTVQADHQQPQAEPTTQSSSTATSATATAPLYPNLQNHFAPSTPPSSSSSAVPSSQQRQRNPHTFTHFPNVRRTSMRPAHQAFLPQPSWIETTLQQLAAAGWIPGNIIGDGLPLLENGEFDYAHASIYWKFFYWLDSWFGTDFCGMKNE